MLKLVINLWVFVVAVNGIEVYTSPDENYEYKFLPIKSAGSRIKFKVKSKNDAHIMLAEKSNPTGSDPYYEIVLGGWYNTKCVIRKDRSVETKAKVFIDGTISESEFRGFWVDYSGGYITVGRENEKLPFISWPDPNPLDVKYVGFATGFDSPGSWITDEEGCTKGIGCAEDRVCSSGVCINPCHVNPFTCEEESFCQVKSHVTSCYQPGIVHKVETSNINYDYIYFPAPSDGSVIKFKVMASTDAHFILTESTNPDVTKDNFCEVVIGGSNNTFSLIRNKREGEENEKDNVYFIGILKDDQYRGFWVQYLDGKLSVGKENEKNPFLMWTLSTPLKFKYFGFATGFGSTGKWILFK